MIDEIRMKKKSPVTNYIFLLNQTEPELVTGCQVASLCQ